MPSEIGNSGGSRFGRHGFGRRVQKLERWTPVKVRNFQRGILQYDLPEDVSEGGAVDMRNVEVSNQDGLIRMPGANVRLELDPGVMGMALFTDMNNETRLVIPAVGEVRTFHTLLTTATEPAPGLVFNPNENFSFAPFGDELFFANRAGTVWSYSYTGGPAPEPGIPQGRSLATIKGRLIVGGATISGISYPMVVAWSAPMNPRGFNFGTDLGSGFEPLVAGQTEGDEIMAVRAMNMDVAAIVCKRSVWIGRATGDLDRPLDFEPRVMGSGCVAKKTCVTTNNGVIYLSHDGVELFDGNVSRKVSAAIDPLILPLDPSELWRYSAAFISSTNRYILMTPTQVFIYEIDHDRWFRRSMAGATDAASFFDLDDPRLVTYLTEAPALGAYVMTDTYATHVINGVDPLCVYESRQLETDYRRRLVSVREISLYYRNRGVQDGIVDVNFLDETGEFNPANVKTLDCPISSTFKTSKLTLNHTGLGLGVQIRLRGTGLTEIAEVEVLARIRGKRIDPDSEL